jgi:hypothetical protein
VRVRTYQVYNGSNPQVPYSNPGSSIGFCAPFTYQLNSIPNNNPPGTIYIFSYNDGSPNDTLQHPVPQNFAHTFAQTSCGASGGTTPNTFYIKTLDTDNNYSSTYLTINHQYQAIPNI